MNADYLTGCIEPPIKMSISVGTRPHLGSSEEVRRLRQSLDRVRTDANGASMRKLILTAIILSMTSPAFAWGPIGHRVTGAIADRNLSGLARANVQLLLGEEDLAEAAT